jgi:hypothetical protein
VLMLDSQSRPLVCSQHVEAHAGILGTGIRHRAFPGGQTTAVDGVRRRQSAYG